MTTSKREKYITFLLGLVLLALPFITSPDISSGWALLKIAPFQQSFLRYFLLVVFLFVNYYVFIPRLYLRKKWVILAIILIGCYVTISQLPGLILGNPQFLGNNTNMPAIRPGGPPENTPNNIMPPPNRPMPYPNNMGTIPSPDNGFLGRDGFLLQFLIVFIISLVVKLNNNLKELENKKLWAELSYLKAQINPHFLFNTLNNVYALALKKSDLTADAVLKLSGMMRYVVTESDQQKVALEKEIKYIEDYIALQELRLSNSVSLYLTINGVHNDKKIAPLILITYIENAFKYGVASNEKSDIVIDITTNQNILTLKVKNTIVKKNIQKEFSTEEGLNNTKRRLEMLYPGQYELDIFVNDNIFNVELKLNL